ncbi:MAG: protein translocase subunit SecF [Candidatus Woesearchaeota archaeon]
MKRILEVYDKHYKKLMIIPFALLILAFLVIGFTYYSTGDFVNKGVSLKGGATVTIYQPLNALDLENYLKEQFPQADISVRSLTSAGQVIAVAVDSDAQENQEIKALTTTIEAKLGLSNEDYDVEVMGSSLGNSFFKQTIYALLIAFLLMGIVVFITFRTFAPSLAVMLAAFSDIVVTLAIFNLTGMKLGTAGIAAFLMLIGYSVDTDMLLSTRVIKRTEGTLMERILGAVKTGMIMTCTTLVAVIVGLIFVKSEVIKQIMFILLIGLLVDMVMTWIQNVGLLRLYLEKKKK